MGNAISLDDAPPSRLTGTGVSPGLARGPVVRMAERPAPPDPAPSVRGADVEWATARRALADVATDLRTRARDADRPARDVLNAQALMALDPAIQADVERRTASGATAARAVHEAFAVHRRSLAAGHLAERVSDLDDVRDRAVAACLGVPLPTIPRPGHPFVLVASDLAPADTAGLDLKDVLAIVTAQGGPTSHTAILARARGIPAVVSCGGTDVLAEGTPVLVDGTAGTVVVDGDAAADDRPASAASAGTAPAGVAAPSPVAAPERAGRTADGHAVPLLANVGSTDEAVAAAEQGAEGIGLLRTEFLFLGAARPPSADLQAAAYARVFAAFAGCDVLVRVLDAGGDKRLPFLGQTDEPNPALGLRGVRALRRHTEVLDEQLTAIARALAASADFGAAVGSRAPARLHVMAPMVADPADAAWFVQHVRSRPDWPAAVPVGVMVEVPAAALMAPAVLAACDFVSVGTNDLVQYTLAADRQLGAVAEWQSPWHPAVLALVARTCAAAVSAGKPVGVCGEAAADPALALVLVGMGASSLSMAPRWRAQVRAALAAHTLEECHELAARALAAPDAAAARAAVHAGTHLPTAR